MILILFEQAKIHTAKSSISHENYWGHCTLWSWLCIPTGPSATGPETDRRITSQNHFYEINFHTLFVSTLPRSSGVSLQINMKKNNGNKTELSWLLNQDYLAMLTMYAQRAIGDRPRGIVYPHCFSKSISTHWSIDQNNNKISPFDNVIKYECRHQCYGHCGRTWSKYFACLFVLKSKSSRN